MIDELKPEDFALALKQLDFPEDEYWELCCQFYIAHNLEILREALRRCSTPEDNEWRTGEPPTNSIGLSDPLNFYSEMDNVAWLALGHYNANKKSFVETDHSEWPFAQVKFWKQIKLPEYYTP